MPVFAYERRAQSARAIAELMERLSRSLVGRSFEHEMNPAQWTALRYLADANDSARQIGSFATFHQTTPSSASQTMGALVKKGLVTKSPAADGRSRVLDLTSKGRRTLAHDPIIALSDAILTLPDAQRLLLAEIVQLLIQAMAAKR